MASEGRWVAKRRRVSRHVEDLANADTDKKSAASADGVVSFKDAFAFNADAFDFYSH